MCTGSTARLETPENDAARRAEAPAWAVVDFLDMLKNQFRELRFVPLSEHVVNDMYTTYGEESEKMVEMVQEIYREHGWPGLERYRKRQCLQAVKTALKSSC